MVPKLGLKQDGISQNLPSSNTTLPPRLQDLLIGSAPSSTTTLPPEVAAALRQDTLTLSAPSSTTTLPPQVAAQVLDGKEGPCSIRSVATLEEYNWRSCPTRTPSFSGSPIDSPFGTSSEEGPTPAAVPTAAEDSRAGVLAAAAAALALHEEVVAPSAPLVPIATFGARSLAAHAGLEKAPTANAPPVQLQLSALPEGRAEVAGAARVRVLYGGLSSA